MHFKVAMRYKNSKTVAMRCKNKRYIKLNKEKTIIQSSCYKRLRYFITKFLSRNLFL